jgi:hypothetical protein
MCKHVAAALYGVGARLDVEPALLFSLRGVDAQDMIAKAGVHLAAPAAGASDKVLADDDMAALFGLDMAEEALPDVPARVPAALPKRGQSARATKRMLTATLAAKRENAGSRPIAKTAAKSGLHGRGPVDLKSDRKLTSARNTPPPLQTDVAKPRRTASTLPANPGGSGSKSRTRSAPTKSAAHLEALIEQATVDCYTEAEQAVGFYTMISEHLALPFKTKILGREADVVGILMNGYDLLLAVCMVGRKRQRISLADIALPSKRPAGAEWVVAYRLWSGRNGSV